MTRRSPQALEMRERMRMVRQVTRERLILARPGHLFQMYDAASHGMDAAIALPQEQGTVVMVAALAAYSRALEWQLRFEEWK